MTDQQQESLLAPTETAAEVSRPLPVKQGALSAQAFLGAAGRRMIVFISYPKDIAPRIMKRMVSGLIKRGFQVWLWDAIPYGFSASRQRACPASE
jgi:hypothetical protein